MEFIREILVVEHDHADFLIQKELLRLAGLDNRKLVYADRIDKVKDPRSGFHPDLVFLDPVLEDSTGLESFHAVQSKFPDIPIIILSGVADTEMAVNAIQAGAQDYLIKGEFDELTLTKTIKYSIERKRSQLRLEESNKRYEFATKATNDILWDSNLLTGEMFLSDRVEVFGYPVHMTQKKGWWESNIHPEDFNRVIYNLEKHFSSGREHWSDIYRFFCADGNYRYINDRGFILRDEAGIPFRMIGSMRDITHETMQQQKLEEERLARHQALLWAAVDGQEKEKETIGRELHDNISQVLASVKMLSSAVLAEMEEPSPLLEKSIKLTEDCIREIQRLTVSLMPLAIHHMNLSEALDKITHDITLSHHIDFMVVLPDALVSDLDEKKQLILYRVAEEQISNILRHAHATEIRIMLGENGGRLEFTVADNGSGFDPGGKYPGIGLKNMKSRCESVGGELRIESAPGKGSSIIAILPK